MSIYDIALFLEAKCSRQDLQELAAGRRLPTHGTKRDLGCRIITKCLEGVPSDQQVSTLHSLDKKTIEDLLDWIRGPVAFPMTTKTGREGECYEWALKFIIAEDEGTLVHGTVWSYPLKKRISHAWVVTETGWVFEPVAGRFFDKEWLYEHFKMEEEQTYTPAEAAATALRHHHFGPWGPTKGYGIDKKE